jgi:hypothetical protein
MLLTEKVARITGGARHNGLGPQHIGVVVDLTNKASCECAAKTGLERCRRMLTY